MASNAQTNWLSATMRMYVAMAMSKSKEIKCDECGSYDDLEFHHKKYARNSKREPRRLKYSKLTNISIHDLQILCCKCHRNAKSSPSEMATVFEDGKRYCIVSQYIFLY